MVNIVVLTSFSVLCVGFSVITKKFGVFFAFNFGLYSYEYD